MNGDERRGFLMAGLGSVAWLAMTGASAGGPAPPLPASIPRRKLGRTGVEVSMLGLGGFHLGMPPDDRTAIELVRTAVDHGMTFMDNCWDYNEGRSQDRMGRALADGYRKKVFLMTKLDGRTRAAAAAQLEQSLRALRTDMIDLVQIHEVIRMTDAERVFAAGGAIEALVAAREAGKLRFIGFTGHKSPDIHLHMLKTADAHGFRFDTVQMPLNVMDAHYDSFERRVLPVLVEKQIGVLGMKPLGSGVFFKSGPLADGTVTATECLHYALSLPTSVVITGCDAPQILQQALRAGATWKPMAEAELKHLLARTATVAARGKLEQYKTTQGFDGTAQNPWWLEGAQLHKPG